VIQSELEIIWSGEWAQQWPPYGTRSGLAAAQHYGFATHLLDWTTNPSTAVHFATCSATSAHSPQAAVLLLDVEDAEQLGLEIVLPPVIVHRLYLQRGVFLDLEAATPAVLQSKIGMIRFPAQPRCPAFATTNGHDRIAIDLLPGEPWFDRLHEWSTANADDPSLEADPMLANIAFTARHGHHPALAQLQGILLPSIPHGQVGMMMGVINDIAGRWLDNQYFYEPRILDVLSKHNPSLIDWLQEIVGLPRLPIVEATV
jgi:hypothetical protein